MSFERKFGDKYSKKFINTAIETGINPAKIFGDKYGKNLMDTAEKQETNFATTAGKK